MFLVWHQLDVESLRDLVTFKAVTNLIRVGKDTIASSQDSKLKVVYCQKGFRYILESQVLIF